MTNRERLQENYEDALFALLMDDVAQTEGERLIRENDALQEDPNAAIPENIDRRYMQVIQRTLFKQKHRASLKKLGQQICRAAVIAAIITSLFVGAYAFSPSFRTGTLNLLLEIDDKLATWHFDDSSQRQLSEGQTGVGSISFDVNIPGGYTAIDYKTLPEQVHIVYENEYQTKMSVDIFEITNATYTYDVENAEYYEEVSIGTNSGILLDKDGVSSIAWADIEHQIFFYVFSDNATVDEVKTFAKNLSEAYGY